MKKMLIIMNLWQQKSIFRFNEGFNRRTEDPINSRLNYGYAVIRSAIARKLVAMAEAFSEGEQAGFSKGEESGFAKGEVSGRINALLDILADYGTVPDDFHARLQNIAEDTLKHWTKLASRADSMDEFLGQI